MTGRELLTMFARLRGIPEHLISQAVEAEVVRLDFKKHASKQCGKYRYIIWYPCCACKNLHVPCNYKLVRMYMYMFVLYIVVETNGS